MRARFGHRRGRVLISWGARMALAAVAFHLVLSFVHIHPWISSTQAFALVEASEGSPGSDEPFGLLADGYCAICANIAAFANLDLPGSPGIVSAAIRAILCLLFALSLRPGRRDAYRLFQTRAPPSAGRLRSL